MLEFDLGESTEGLHGLFEQRVPCSARLFSALRQRHAAQALVDSVAAPRWCVLRSGYHGYTFVGGEISCSLLGLVIGELRKCGPVLLHAGDKRADIFPRDYGAHLATIHTRPSGPALHSHPHQPQLIAHNIRFIFFGAEWKRSFLRSPSRPDLSPLSSPCRAPARRASP